MTKGQVKGRVDKNVGKLRSTASDIKENIKRGTRKTSKDSCQGLQRQRHRPFGPATRRSRGRAPRCCLPGGRFVAP